jgi:hypothetical protein
MTVRNGDRRLCGTCGATHEWSAYMEEWRLVPGPNASEDPQSDLGFVDPG